jgi:hypothetical protein
MPRKNGNGQVVDGLATSFATWRWIVVTTTFSTSQFPEKLHIIVTKFRNGRYLMCT